MKLDYRLATNKDKHGLRALGLASYGQFKNVLSEENWVKLNTSLTSESFYDDLLALSTCFVCEDGEQVVGMAFLVPSGNPTDIFEADWSYIRMVGVDPAYSGKGIGKELTLMCIEFAKETGEDTVALHTSEFMNAARHIYESLGFRKVKELPSRLGKRYWLYQLDLKK